MNYTYKQLLELLKTLPEDRLGKTVCLYDRHTHAIAPITGGAIVENMWVEHRNALDGRVKDEQPLLILGSFEED